MSVCQFRVDPFINFWVIVHAISENMILKYLVFSILVRKYFTRKKNWKFLFLDQEPTFINEIRVENFNAVSKCISKYSSSVSLSFVKGSLVYSTLHNHYH